VDHHTRDPWRLQRPLQSPLLTMDISGTIASVLWKDHPEQANHEDTPQASLKDFTEKLVKDERRAREAALAEMRKMLDWRFVHFAEEFRQQLARIESGSGCAKEQPGLPPGRSEVEQRLATLEKNSNMVDRDCTDGGVTDEPRLHLLEGKFALAEHRLAEVQRWTKAMEEEFVDEKSRLAEAEAWLAHLDRRVSDTECHLGGRGALASRLATVERLSVDGTSQRAVQRESQSTVHVGDTSRSGGGSSGSRFSGGASSIPPGSVDFQFGRILGKDRAWTTVPSTKVSTNYATPSSQDSLTPTTPSPLRRHGSR